MTVLRDNKMRQKKKAMPDQRRPGASQQWIQNQLGQQNFNGAGYQDRPGIGDNLGLQRGQLGNMMNSLADQGLGRKGLNFLLNNQAAQLPFQSGMGGGGAGGVIPGATPEMIRYMMQSGNFQGGVGLGGGRNTQLQSDFFNQFPGMREAYLGGLPGAQPGVRQPTPGAPTPQPQGPIGEGDVPFSMPQPNPIPPRGDTVPQPGWGSRMPNFPRPHPFPGQRFARPHPIPPRGDVPMGGGGQSMPRRRLRTRY